jgi:hypothetical protein
MSAIDPIEGLLALGVITREQLQQSQSVDPDIATTSVGRLVAVGAPAAELLQAISSLAGIPLATPAMLEAARPVAGLAPPLARALRDVPAAPLARQADGTLDVAVAEPQAVHRLSALGVAKHRAFLALEFHVRDAAERVLGDDAPPNLADDLPADGGVDAAFAFGSPLAPPAAPAPRSPPPRPQRPVEAAAEPPAIVLMPFNAGPPPATNPSNAPPPSEGMVGGVAAPMERGKAVREKYAPSARPHVENAAAAKPSGDPFAFMDAMKSQPAPTSTPAPKPSGIDTDRAPARQPPTLQLARPAEKTRPPGSIEEPKRSRAGLVLGVVVVVGLAAGGVLYGPTILAKLHPPATPADPNAALAAEQQKELDLATSLAKSESPVDAIIHCDNVLKLSRTTRAAHQCAILGAEQHFKVKDPDPLDDLKAIVDATPASDPDKAAMQETFDRLDTKLHPGAHPPPSDVAGADAGTKAAEPKKPDFDLDHDVAPPGTKAAPGESQ